MIFCHPDSTIRRSSGHAETVVFAALTCPFVRQYSGKRVQLTG